MKLKKLQLFYLFGILSCAYFVFSSYSGGITGKAATGCGGAGCHTQSAATIDSMVGLPAQYTHGTTYLCTLIVYNPAKIEGGFDMTVNVGSLAVVDPGTTLNGTQELRHNTPKTAISGASFWVFNWTAPASGNTDLVMNVAGNAVDGNNGATNDAFSTDVFNSAAPAALTPPTVTGVNVTAVTQTSATVNASINANNKNTSAVVEYGLTASYGSTQNMTPASITGATPTAASGALSGLTPGTTYHYRVKATNADGVTTSNDATFMTQANSVSSIEKSSIQIYPNPVLDYIYYSNKEDKGAVKFNILSVGGATQNLNIEKTSEGNYKIQTTSLAAGNYVLLMELNGKKYYHHFAK